MRFGNPPPAPPEEGSLMPGRAARENLPAHTTYG